MQFYQQKLILSLLSLPRVPLLPKGILLTKSALLHFQKRETISVNQVKQLGQHCLKRKEQAGLFPNQFLKQILFKTLLYIISATTKNFELIQEYVVLALLCKRIK